MKKTIQLNQNDLNKMISESIMKVLSEGTTDNVVGDNFFEIASRMGDNFVTAMYKWLSSDDIEEFVRIYGPEYGLDYDLNDSETEEVF